ncbi:MAG: hypothetical protein GY765_41980 [bacterium]|nr:hypothetical protein [bacterium]
MFKTLIKTCLAVCFILAVSLQGFPFDAGKSKPILTQGSNACTSTIESGQTLNGQWTEACMSQSRSGRYARYYEFTVEANTAVAIDLKSSEFTYLILHNPDGNYLAGDANRDGTNSRITYTLSEPGTYTIEATTEFTRVSGDFTISLTCYPNANCRATIQCGDTLSGTWSAGCYAQLFPGMLAKSYEFTQERETLVYITVESQVDVYVGLRDPENNVIGSNWFDEPLPIENTTRMLIAQGTYSLEISTLSPNEGEDFSVSIECHDASGCVGALSCGETVHDNWRVGCYGQGYYVFDMAKFYKITAVEGQTAAITLSHPDGNLRLFDPKGNRVARGETDLHYTFPASGVYTVEAAAFKEAYFSISYTCSNDSCTFPLNPGDTLDVDLSAGCYARNRSGAFAKYYELTGVAGNTAVFDTGGNTDLSLYLSDAGGNIVAQKSGYEGFITTLPQSGTYTLEVTSYSPVNFPLSYNTHDEVCTTSINCGDTVSGNWSEACRSSDLYAYPAKYYQFTGGAGQGVEINLHTTSYARLFLYNSRGNGIGNYTVSPDGWDLNLTTHLPFSGTYLIEVVAGDSRSTADFTLSLSCSTPQCTVPMLPNQYISNEWTDACVSRHRSDSYARYFQFNAAADLPIGIQRWSEPETCIYLLDADDNVLAFTETRDSLAYTIPATGTYTIEVTTALENSDDYFTIYMGCDPAELELSKTQISFDTGASNSLQDTFMVTNSGNGTLSWRTQYGASWLSCTPTSGSGPQTVTVTANPDGLRPGTYTSTITVFADAANDSPQTVTVSLTVHGTGETSVPFGEYLTPVDGSTVAGSVPFTGWVLDDIGMESVRLYCEGHYIGEAVFVEGARPDIEDAYPNYPDNDRAGWGYMMLTNFLPGGGNGEYTISAVATDTEGNSVTLGSKTITVDNVNAVKPFGAIDTPAQSGTATGSSYRNNGWVLTPPPNSIPLSGDTVTVFVDSDNLGSPTYGIYREDIASYFPYNNNSDGAGAYLDIDTTKYADGVHTIYWVATDDAGNSDGIGSRFFTISNTGGNDRARTRGLKGAHPLPVDIPANAARPLERTGFDKNASFTPMGAPHGKEYVVDSREMERVELKFDGAEIIGGTLLSGDRETALPIGSSIEGGVFSWIPIQGFTGDYTVVFLVKDEVGVFSRSTMLFRIHPKFSTPEKK